MIYVPEYTENSCCYMCVDVDWNYHCSIYCNGIYILWTWPNQEKISGNLVLQEGANAVFTVSYKDYFVNSHYLYRVGSTSFNNYNVNVNCLDNNTFTSAYFI